VALFDSSVSGQHLDEIVHSAVTMKVNELSIDLRAAALSCIENKELQVASVARSASVAETTLRRWITALSSGQEVRRGTHTLMTMTEERALVGLILTRQSLNAPFTKQTAGQVASLMLTRRGWKFGNAANLPSRDWWEAFLKRWPGLSFRKTSRLSGDALLRPTRGNLEPWFELVQELQKLVPRGRWFNMDESQVRPDVGSKTVLVARGSQHIHAPKPGYSKHVTIAPCVSANGDVLPTLWVFQGKRVTTDLLKGADSKDAVAVTGGFSCLSHEQPSFAVSGWMTSKLFLLYLQWLDAFLPKERPCVLLVDQHESRFSSGVSCLACLLAHCSQSEALEFAASRGIILLALPSQLTWLLQPLDLAVYKSFKSKLADIFAASPGNLNRLNFVATVAPAFRASFQSPAIRAGWAQSGIWPFAPNLVLDSAAVQSAELRSQYIESAQAEAERLADAPFAMLDVSNDGSDQSSSSSSSSSSSLSSAQASQLGLAACYDANGDLLVAPGERITLLDLSSRVAPILTTGKRKRKGRELTSGADLTSEEHRKSIADKPRKPSKRDLSATLWAPGMPAPPKRARGKRKAKPKSGGSSEKPKSPSKPSAKPKRKTRNKRIFDEDEDFQSSPAPLSEWKASAPASPASESAPSSNDASAAPQCPECGLACLESQRPRACDICQQLWHSACAGVQRRSRTRVQAFTCPHCQEAEQAEFEAGQQRKRRRVAAE